VFVDRTRRSKTRDVNSEIAQRLAGGDPVLLFGALRRRRMWASIARTMTADVLRG
jgi:hypothetical protein